ncbi:MAG: hypothetical protein KAR42_10480 [candidate division Zixibacteria bacterium]|nr:hypothetical protein [candidate division Zixibacteria bacterium]
MKQLICTVLVFSALLAMWSPSMAQSVTPFTNEISYFKNVDDAGKNQGTTLQVISINEFTIGTNFIFEFTGDFNWRDDFAKEYDYYLELSIVKPIYKSMSLNYQRIHSTFEAEPINQFGIRIALFTGS